jgi:hypothetical protein
MFHIKCAAHAYRYVLAVESEMDHYLWVAGEVLYPDEEGMCVIPDALGNRTVEFRIAEYTRKGYPREFQVVAGEKGNPLPAEHIGRDGDDYDVLFSLPVSSNYERSLIGFKLLIMEVKVFEIFTIDISRERNNVYAYVPNKGFSSRSPEKGYSSIILQHNPNDGMLHFEEICFPIGLGFLRRYNRPIRAVLEKYNRWVGYRERVPVFFQNSPYMPDRQSTLSDGVTEAT